MERMVQRWPLDVAWAIGRVLLPFIELGDTRRGWILGVEVRHHGFNFGHIEVRHLGHIQVERFSIVKYVFLFESRDLKRISGK